MVACLKALLANESQYRSKGDSKDWEKAKGSVLTALTKIGDPRAVPVLVQVASTGEHEVEANRALNAFPFCHVRGALLEIIARGEEWRRAWAVSRLRLPADEEMVAAVAAQLDGEEPNDREHWWACELREVAVAKLAQFGGATALAVLPRLLRSPRTSSRVRTATATALTSLGWQPGSTDEAIVFAISSNRYDAVSSYGPAAIPHVRAAPCGLELRLKILVEVGGQALSGLIDDLAEYHSQNAHGGSPRLIRDAIETILRRSAGNADVADLTRLSKFKDATRRGDLVTSIRDLDYNEPDEQVDCSVLRELAGQELKRRAG